MSVQYVKLGDVCAKDSSNIAQKDLKDCFGKYPVYGAGGYIQNVDFYHQEDEYIAIVKDGAGVGRAMILPAKSSVIGTMQYIIPDKNKVDMHYLYYAIINMALGKYFSGATIPHIYFKDYQKEIFKLPDLETQKKIADNLKNIDLIIAKKNKQIGLFNELVKSRFIEMFGSLGSDKFGWGLMKLGNCCEINPSKINDNRLKENLYVSFIPMSCVTDDGKITEMETKTYDEVKSGFTYFKEGDVLFAKITPCMENGKGAIAIGLYNKVGFGSTEFHVLRPIKEKCNSYWLYMVTMFSEFRLIAESNMTGSAGQKRVPVSFLENFKISVPPIELQNEFADFFKQTDKSKFVIQKSLNYLL